MIVPPIRFTLIVIFVILFAAAKAAIRINRDQRTVTFDNCNWRGDIRHPRMYVERSKLSCIEANP
jgi:hypothetical protein